MKLGPILIATATMLTVSSAAYAATKYILGNAVSPTSHSGNTGLQQAKAGHGGDYQGLHTIHMWENNNNPCSLQAVTRHLNTYGTRSSKWNACSGSENAKRTVSFSGTGTDTYITGMRVCLSNRNKLGNDGVAAVKGLEVWGKTLNRGSGALVDAGTKKWERPNCSTWSNVVHCSAGHVATKVNIHYQHKRATGLGLECRKVQPK
jgi:hypothetical protein